MSTHERLSALDIARSYIDRGWNPIPVPFRSKKPIGEEWQKRVIDHSNVAQFFNGAEMNIGVQMGKNSGGLTDVDLDCPEAVAIASFLLPKTGAIFGRQSARYAHWLYKTSLAETEDKAEIQLLDSSILAKAAGKKAMLVELRIGGGNKGAQTVFPGSVHQDTAELIKWEEANPPSEIASAELVKAVKLVAVGALLIRYWPGTGARHNAALAVGGFLARAGRDPNWIKYFVEQVARAAGCKDVAAKKDAAYELATNALAGKKTFGLPTIKELFGEHVASKIAEWLGYTGGESVDADFATTPVEPVDLWGQFDPPSLPRGLLPDILERFAFEQGLDMGADMAGIAVSALAVCAAAIPDKIKLQVKRHNTGWLESARIWVTPIGPPSTKKTPIMAAAVRPLRKIDSEMARQYAAERARYDQLPTEEKKLTEPPEQTRLLLQDTTIEAAQEILKDSPDGVLCYQDELSGWFGSMEKYSSSKGGARDRAFWLEAFNGGQYSVNRIGRGSSYIDPLSVSLLGGIQPEPIRKIADESVDDGLLQRILPVILRPAVQSRDEEPSEVVSEYNALISRLHHLDNPFFGGGAGLDFNATGHLRFDAAAQAYRDDLERKHLDLLSIERINRKLAAHIGKYDGIFARLCVIWHCVESEPGKLPRTISERTARRVGAFLHGFLLPHALAFYTNVLGLSNDHDRLTNVAGYILAHKKEKLTNRDIQQGDRAMRGLDRQAIDSIFDQLDALGWVNRTPGPYPKAPSHWTVNPVVHVKFAERGKAEAERRARDREKIAVLMGSRGAA